MKSDNGAEWLADKHVVLLGAGHTNAHILRMWGMNAIPNTDLTCISDHAFATYSGMLPAVLAGQQPRHSMQIDLVRLCAFVNARLITHGVTNIDTEQQRICFEDRPPVPFDVLSIGIGSVPSTDGVLIHPDAPLLKIKPMQTFLDRLAVALATASKRLAAEESSRPLQIVVAGSGVAGVEISFCLPAFIQKQLSSPFELRIVSRSREILDGVIPAMRVRVEKELTDRGITVECGRTIVEVSTKSVRLNDGSERVADLVIWATGASPPELISRLNLPKDARGFLATDRTLQSTSGVPVFAVGDSGSIEGQTLPKAGVYAVRQGPVLWDNIKATLSRESRRTYVPQRSFLKLVNTGDGSAIGEWKGFSFAGRWAMAWKQHIDSRFMQMYRVPDVAGDSSDVMQCRGCGCKLGSDVLEEVLQSDSHSTQRSGGPLVPPEQLDDAAVVQLAAGSVVASTDFFTSPVADPWLAGRISALHAASDLIAMGATVKAALANVVVPEGSPAGQRDALNDLMAGARLEFEAMGASIVGGHTIVGPRWESGFTVIGEPNSNGPLLRKNGLQSGDILYLTKPLGIGVLLAAHMRYQCHADAYGTLMKAILQRQHRMVAVAAEHGITAGTDVTGFGLIGHLVEMLSASLCAATVDLEKMPVLPGAPDAVNQGIESTLVPRNLHAECHVEIAATNRNSATYRILFDPQTCGGLLLGVKPELAKRFEQATAANSITATAIGIVEQNAEDRPPIRIH